MSRFATILLLMMTIALGAAGCGPDEQQCNELCDWWAEYCTSEPRQSCMDDCMDSSADDVSYAHQQCIGYTTSTCKGASCCLRFVYTEYYYSNNCL
jgi:hypothetical protein